MSKWYEARELIDAADGPLVRIDPVSQALARNLQSFASNSNRVSAGDESVWWCRFKPMHEACGTLEMPIFRGTSCEDGSVSADNEGMRNIKSAEMVLRLQHRLIDLFKRVSDLDERLQQIQLASRVAGKKADANLGFGKLPWPRLLMRIFWFAWPIALLFALNRAWPRQTTTTTTTQASS